MIAVYELLFHQRRVSPESDAVLDKFRIDPTVSSNIKSWLLLRIRYLEDVKLDRDINVSIALMNRAVFVCIIFFGWLFCVYFMKLNYEELDEEENPTIMTWLGLAYILNIMIPMIYSLNQAV